MARGTPESPRDLQEGKIMKAASALTQAVTQDEAATAAETEGDTTQGNEAQVTEAEGTPEGAPEDPGTEAQGEGEPEGEDGAEEGTEDGGDVVPDVHPESAEALGDVLAGLGIDVTDEGSVDAAVARAAAAQAEADAAADGEQPLSVVLGDAAEEILGRAAEELHEAVKADESAEASLGEALAATMRLEQERRDAAEGEAEGTPEAAPQEGAPEDGQPEAQEQPPAAAAPAGFTHDGKKAFGFLPTQRKPQLSRITDVVYIVGGINPPAQWPHNGRMIRALHCGHSMGWEVGQDIELVHAKSHAWVGTYRVVGILTGGKLTDGVMAYKGNDGREYALTLEGKASLWLCLPDGVRDFDARQLPLRSESSTPPAAQPQEQPEAPAEGSDGEAQPEGTQPEGGTQPQPQPQPPAQQGSRPGSPRRDRNRNRDTRLRSESTGPGRA